MQSKFLLDLSSQLQKGSPFGESLASDNHSGIHPRLLEAMISVNLGTAHAYGADPVSEEAETILRELFGADTSVAFCFNGTAANVLSLRPLLSSYEAVLASDVSHLNVDECGAPEFHLRSKLIAVPSDENGKISPAAVKPFLIRKGDQHFAQPKAVSITQPTELGTLYSREEIAALALFCRENELWLHMDGARFCNAAVRLGMSFKEMTEGVDVLSLGGTKNGFLFGEAVLFISPRAARIARSSIAYHRKQMMQLASKSRFIGAQFIEYFGTSLWREIAEHSCAMADLLRQGLEPVQHVEIKVPTESNAVFARFPNEWIKQLRKQAFFYVWDEQTRLCRLMTSFATTESQISQFVGQVQHLESVANGSVLKT